ncbi:acyl-CoA carboxylase subunit epsilon [Motilibacter aurantiacus]|uniref:acyl-CoA carboxylase subunit epsilon n=1 Tax=Motilibacter aurantiacus TaxID=2714955 RepID=UPI00140BD776|nr:acyl-CoA carboxylase subunit epsilon [Motilibacter aurantiacus]
MSIPQEPGDEVSVVHGSAAPEDIAALLAVLISHAAAQPPAEPPHRSAWGNRAYAHRRMLHPGPGAWQAAVRGL